MATNRSYRFRYRSNLVKHLPIALLLDLTAVVSTNMPLTGVSGLLGISVTANAFGQKMLLATKFRRWAWIHQSLLAAKSQPRMDNVVLENQFISADQRFIRIVSGSHTANVSKQPQKFLAASARGEQILDPKQSAGPSNDE